MTPAEFRAGATGLLQELAGTDAGQVITTAATWVAEQLASERGAEQHERHAGVEVHRAGRGGAHRDPAPGPDA